MLIVTIAAGMIMLTILGSKYQTKMGQEDFKHFNNAYIEGIIKSVYIKHHGSGFKIESDSRDFVFYPYTDKTLNEGHIFHHFAEPRDKVIKSAFSDTLYLIKDRKVYKYTFQREN
jgi:hypothetical protein